MIITAEYENGAIKLWPPPDPMEGKRMAQEILDSSPRDTLEKEIEELEGDLEEVRNDLSDLRLDWRRVENELRACVKQEDPIAVRERLKEILRIRFRV